MKESLFSQVAGVVPPAFRFFFDALLLSYAKIFFSENKITGVFILLSTFAVPSIGLCGLYCAVVGNLTAYAFGMDRQSIRKGIYGFNCVLTGLGAGFFYGISMKILILLFLLCIFLTLLTLLLNHLFHQNIGLSAMSIPFNIIIGVSLVMGKRFTIISPMNDLTDPFFPIPIETFFQAMSAILFQGNTLSGVLVSIGVLIYSRIAFVLMVVGFVVGIGGIQFFDIDAFDLKQGGFNAMFSALAIGGVWMIPSIGSLAMAILTATLTLILILGTTAFFADPIYSLAWPFNIAVILVVYGLKNRLYPIAGLDLHTGHFISPEENLGKQREQIRQFRYKGFAICLPFFGRWKITQGIDGQHTHKEDWRFAYDFQAVDSVGRLYKNNGEDREDFYAYGLPVLAPLEGIIERLQDGISDNAIGQVNTEERWGNHVIIKHAENYYSCLAHLKQGSIKWEVGQSVQKGEVIGSCGNSGRSPYPHIHLQFQMRPEVGSASISFEFSNVCIVGEKPVFLPKGILAEDTTVQNLGQTVEQFFPYSLNKEWVLDFNGVPEIWKMEVDFYGNTVLVSAPNVTRLFFTFVNGVLRVNQLDGKRTTGLYLFGSLISEIPFVENERGLQWTSIDSTDYGVNVVVAKLFDLLSLMGLGLIRRLDCETQLNGNEFRVITKPSIYLKTPFKNFCLKQHEKAEFLFMADMGLQEASFGGRKLWLK
jgi:urea transporter/murein DD-endopeptidase MepM/ murein hydrolase activator NlpD